MAGRKQKKRQENALVRYFRNTMSELRKVRWPTRQEAWALTRLVLLVTLVMAAFLGAVDRLFEWILGGIVSQNILFVVLGLVVALLLAASAVLIGRGEEV
jgi:preprotein translocase subunit SecE